MTPSRSTAPKTRRPAGKTARPRRRSTPADANSVVAWLERTGTQRTRDGMARYGLPSDKAVGIPVGTLKVYAKTLGRDHDLAVALWGTGIYEARLLAAFIGDPARLTPALMDRWCRDFDNWGVCDTVCFSLFDRSPHAWSRVEPWADSGKEFVKRAGFALLACLGVHDKAAGDEAFARYLPLIERGAGDDRNFVKKGVSWALRVVGRRSPALNASAVALARRLAASADPPARWVGRDALRDLTSAVVARTLARQRAKGR